MAPQRILCPGNCGKRYATGKRLAHHIARSPACKSVVNALATDNHTQILELDPQDQWLTCQPEPEGSDEVHLTKRRRFHSPEPIQLHLSPPQSPAPQSPHLQSPPPQSPPPQSPPPQSPPPQSPPPQSPPPQSPPPQSPLNSPAPSPSAIIIEESPYAGATYGQCKTRWEIQWEAQTDIARHPFMDSTEWELARWLGLTPMSMKAMDTFFQTEYVKQHPLKLSFQTAAQFRRCLEDLPGVPRWKTCTITLPDAPDEHHQLYYRNINECVDYLVGNPAFKDSMTFVPRKEFEKVEVGDSGIFEKGDRIFSEMWTADKWHEVQDALPHGTTICPIILASDATHTTDFSGDQKVHPVYMSIGNISKDIRAKTSHRAFILLAYLPTPTFTTIPNISQPRSQSKSKSKKPSKKVKNEMQSILKARLFHCSLKIILEPLHSQGLRCRQIPCCDGWNRKIFSFLSTIIADLEEQWLIACTRGCTQCEATHAEFGDSTPCRPRTCESILTNIQDVVDSFSDDEYTTREFAKQMAGHRQLAVHEPFWQDLPFFELDALGCDVLHGLHKYFKDHTFSWCRNIVGPAELDRRFKMIPRYPNFRAFTRGISHISQWSGKEHRDLQRYIFLVTIGAMPNDCSLALRADLDFIYLAQYPSHTDTTLATLDGYNATFHVYKDAFIRAGGRVSKKNEPHFRIPKLHNKLHFSSGIRRYGTTDNYNTEVSERYHIDYAKSAIPATNGKDVVKQMVRWLDRQDKIFEWDAFIKWCQNQPSSPTSYADQSESDDDADDDNDPEFQFGTAAEISICHVNKHPVAKAKRLDVLADRFPGLIHALHLYLSRPSNANPHTQRLSRQKPGLFDIPLIYHTLDIWDSFRIQLPVLDKRHDKIETRRVRARLLEPQLNSQCDPVFIDVDPDNPVQDGVKGLRIAQVRLIFRPTNLDPRSPHPKPTFLCYVEWFSRLDNHEELEVYGTQRLRRVDGTPHWDVIELSSIVRPCPLVPEFTRQATNDSGGEAVQVTSENCLETVDAFYINPFHCKATYQTIF